jgi:VWFA-related protein
VLGWGYSVTRSKCIAAAIAGLFTVPWLVCRVTGAQTKPQTTQAKPNSPAQTTIKTQVRQVLFDVVVTDGKNDPVAGLTREDFSVTEDGALQQILSFEVHTSTGESAVRAEPPLDLSKLRLNTFLNLSRAREDLPLNVILFDVLNTPISDQSLARRDIKKFLMNQPAGSRYAIFVLSDKLHLLQGVTDSEAELLAAMDSRAARSQSTGQGVPNSPVLSASTALADSGLVPNFAGPQEMLARLQHLEGLGDSYLLQRRLGVTVDAFEEISRFLRGVPGRKNLLWLSGSFPVGVLPGGDPIDPFSRAVDFSPELKQAADQLTLNQVAVYPIDIRGLAVNPIYDASNNRAYTASSLENDREKFWLQLVGDHDTMEQLAEFTGGHAFYETNGFEQALRMAAEDGSNYYTLSYSPSNTKFDGRLRKIHVNVARKSVHLSYRRNYFADDEATLAQRAMNAPLEKRDAAMERGTPASHELLFSVHAKTVGSPADVTPEQIKDLSQFTPFAKFKNWDSVKMQKYELEFALLRKQVTYLITPDGLRHAALEFLYSAYDGDSSLLLSGTWNGDPTISPQALGQARAGMYRARLTVAIPVNTSWLRIGVRDAADSRIGSLEIPLPLRTEQPVASAR